MTPDPGDLDRVVRAALEEDLRYGPDVTTAAVIPPGTKSVADIVARQPGTLAGLPVVAAVLDVACPAATFTPQARDGDRVAAGNVVARVEGPLAGILTAERTLLNFLTHLSGIATATRAWVDAIDGTGAYVRDTRKTVPGLRALEKYAVRCGGGVNHRMGLGDAALIKDNHIAAAGGVAAAFRAVLAAAPGVVVEVECDTLGQVGEALAAGAALILLDNMSLDQMRSAVAMARAYPAATLEASGGLRLENAREVASTGVHYLSVGALTHSSPALDLALDVGLSASRGRRHDSRPAPSSVTTRPPRIPDHTGGRSGLVHPFPLVATRSKTAPNLQVPRIARGGAVLLGNSVGEGAGDRGGAAGDLQFLVDVLQVGAHGSLGDAEPPGDLGVGVPGGQQAQQVILAGGEPGDWVAAPFGVQVGLVQVRAQQHQQRPVTLGEVRAGASVKDQPHIPPGRGGRLRQLRQGQHEMVFHPLRPYAVGVHSRTVPLPRRVEVRGLGDGTQVTGADWMAADQAIPVMGPEHPIPFLGEAGVVVVGIAALQPAMNLPPGVVVLERYSLAADLVHQVGQEGRR